MDDSDDERADSFSNDDIARSVQELQATIGGTVNLLIKAGIFTKLEFRQAKAAADQLLEESRAKKRLEQEQEFREELSRLLVYVRQLILAQFPGAKVDSIITKSDRRPDSGGALLRLSTPQLLPAIYAASVEEQIRQLVAGRCSQLAFYSYLLPLSVIVVAADEVETDALSLKFEAVLRQAELKLAADQDPAL